MMRKYTYAAIYAVGMSVAAFGGAALVETGNWWFAALLVAGLAACALVWRKV